VAGVASGQYASMRSLGQWCAVVDGARESGRLRDAWPAFLDLSERRRVSGEHLSVARSEVLILLCSCVVGLGSHVGPYKRTLDIKCSRVLGEYELGDLDRIAEGPSSCQDALERPAEMEEGRVKMIPPVLRPVLVLELGSEST
jgi:hypothetical protein